jgi:hypothetical protein
MAFTIFPEESLHTTACTEKVFRIVVLKFTLKVPARGEDQNSLTRGEGVTPRKLIRMT